MRRPRAAFRWHVDACLRPDLSHAALTDEGGHVAVPEAVAGFEGHRLLVP